MSITVPLEYGRFYHIYNRGNNRETIFFEDENYRYFLKLYVKYIVPVAETYAYCLLKNHFHFLIRIRTEDEQKRMAQEQNSATSKMVEALNPTQQFANLSNSYTKSINKAYKRVGSLFQHRFGRIFVDSDQYFTHLITYIHLNPQKHRYINNFQDYYYSSYQAIYHKKPSHVEVTQVLEWFGGKHSFAEYHQNWANERFITHLIGDDGV